MKRLLVTGLIAGLIVFVVSFQLLGGSLTQLTAATPFVTPQVLMGGLASLIGGVVTVAVAWFNSSIKTTLTVFDIKNENSHKAIESQVGNIQTSLVNVVGSMGKIASDVSDMKLHSNQINNFRKSLLRIQEESCEYLSLDPSGVLKEFGMVKSKAFRDFVMGVHDLGFSERVTSSSIRDLGIAAAEDVRRKGYELLSRSFVDAYYEGHLETTIKYFNGVDQILDDPDNSKGSRFQERSERFMKAFLRDLQTCYIENQGYLDKIS